MGKTQDILFSLLRQALGTERGKSLPVLDANDWPDVYQLAKEQFVSGIAYETVKQLSGEQCPPEELQFLWTGEAEHTKGKNFLLNEEAERLTKLFTQEGRRTAILKGQANARLYPNPYSRQCGDIDLWVEGGRKSVSKLLVKMELIEQKDLKTETSYHHIHLPKNDQGVEVEIHFRPSSGNYNPFTNRPLQKYLEAEILKSELCPKGFCVPSMLFALIMQMAHIQRHYLDGGIGLRQLVDYHVLLTKATQEERDSVSPLLKRMGLRHTAGAVMWVLGEVTHLPESLMLMEPDKKRGCKMLDDMLEDGNLGLYAKWKKTDSDINFFFRKEKQYMRRLTFAPMEVIWMEVSHWGDILRRLPERIRRGRLSLRES
jgi:hypothetical protein